MYKWVFIDNKLNLITYANLFLLVLSNAFKQYTYMLSNFGSVGDIFGVIFISITPYSNEIFNKCSKVYENEKV